MAQFRKFTKLRLNTFKKEVKWLISTCTHDLNMNLKAIKKSILYNINMIKNLFKLAPITKFPLDQVFDFTTAHLSRV